MFSHLEKSSLHFSNLISVIRVNLLNPFNPLCFIIISLVFFFLGKLLFSIIKMLFCTGPNCHG